MARLAPLPVGSVPELNEIFEHMVQQFRQGQLIPGLVQGVSMAGEQLSAYFPFEKNDQNELSDEISF